MSKRRIGILTIPALIILAIGVYYIPPVHDRLAWRLDDLRSQIKYFFNPPDQAVFQPVQSQQQAIEAIVSATLQAYQTAQAMPSITPTAVSGDAHPTPTPTATSMPLPASVNLPGVVYVDQTGGWNLCGPANLTMALKFWSWKGSRDIVIKAIKPGENNPKEDFVTRGKTDKNVMPYEMVDFVNGQADYRSLFRYGGDVQVVKTLIANGFPVLAEKGIYETDTTGKTSWMGHYQFITGYDDNTQTFLVQDTYLKGPNYHIDYHDFLQGWRSFDYIFLVVYPSARETEVMNLLGPYSDSQWAAQHALELANADVQALTGIDLFFAWFAKGTSHVALQQYVDAATAYDQAFSVYSTLNPDYSTRPWRMMWYQTGPYFAYFYSGRYQDVINLANFTLDKTSGTPTLEESLYWRGMAEYATGQTTAAINDVRRSVYYNKNFQPGIAKLQEWGVGP